MVSLLAYQSRGNKDRQMTDNRKNLIRILGRVQNSVQFQNVDILTFAGWKDVTDAEVGAHIISCFGSLDKKRQSEILSQVRELQLVIGA